MNRYLCLLALCLAVLSPVTAAELTGDQPHTFSFEARLASWEAVEGWPSVPGLEPDQTLWIAPEATLTNADVAQAWLDRMDGEFCVGLQLTEEGAIKLARLTKAHIGDHMALMIDGRVTAAPRIAAEITGGRAILQGNFTEEEAQAIAEGIVGN